MSAKIMGQVWECNLAFNKAYVLLAMADHADHEGASVFPRLGLIAWKTGYSLPTVKRLVRELREDGILVPYRKTPGGVVVYRIELAHVPRKPPYSEAPAGRPAGAGDHEPRGPRKTRNLDSPENPYQFDTTLFDTHNRHEANNKKNSLCNSSYYRDEASSLLDWEKQFDEFTGGENNE